MTRTTSARVAGVTYLLYIAVAFPALMLFNRATDASGIAAKLARVAGHVSDMRITIILGLLSCFAALVLAVALYGVTRDEDHELAVLGLVCRVGEGVLGGLGLIAVIGVLWLATSSTGTHAMEPTAANVLGAFLFRVQDWVPIVCATFFAVGSTIFSYLLLRGRMVPVALAWLGVLASVLLVVLLPLRLAGFLEGGIIIGLMWAPMAVFEIVLGVWLIIKGVPARAAR